MWRRGEKMGSFPGAEGKWRGWSEGCSVFTHRGLYLLAIVPIKLHNKPPPNSVANNNKHLFLILMSTRLLGFITSRPGLALLGFKLRVESVSVHESLIFPGPVTPEAYSSHREGRAQEVRTSWASTFNPLPTSHQAEQIT